MLEASSLRRSSRPDLLKAIAPSQAEITKMADEMLSDAVDIYAKQTGKPPLPVHQGLRSGLPQRGAMHTCTDG